MSLAPVALWAFLHPAHALRLTWDGGSETWCPTTDPCVDSAYTSGDYATQAARLGVGEDQVNLFNGELTLSSTDLVLPGVYGLDLAILRTYSSKVVDETLAPVEPGWAGLGWQVLPGGRLYVDPATFANHVWLELPGRGRQRAFLLSSGDALYRSATDGNAWPGQASATAWITPDFTAVYDAGGGTYRAITTAGVVFEFDTSAGPSWDGWTYGESVFDAHGSELTISYATSGQPGALSSVSDGSRTVTFGLDGTGYLGSMSWTNASGGTSTTTYVVSGGLLEEVTLPTGETTAYTYAAGVGDYDELESVTLPTGALTTYTWEDLAFNHDVDPETGLGVSYQTRVVSTKTVDLGAEAHVWSWTWDGYESDDDTTTRTTAVELPDGTWIEHDFYAFGFASLGEDTGGAALYEAVDRAQVGSPVQTRVYASESAGEPSRGRLVQYTYGDGGETVWNLLEISSASDNPFTEWYDTTKILLPYDEITWMDAATAGDGGDVAYVQYGEVATDYDEYGNNRLSCEAGIQPFTADSASVAGPIQQRTWAWATSPVLEGWNLVRLPRQETVRANVSTSSTCPSSGPILSRTTTTWSDSGDSLGWPEQVSRPAYGSAHGYSARFPTSNPSSDQTVDVSYDFDRSDPGDLPGFDVVLDFGGSTAPLRTQRIELDHGTTARVGFEDGASVLWLVQRAIDPSTGLVVAETDANGDLDVPGAHLALAWDASGVLDSSSPPLDAATTFDRAYDPLAVELELTATQDDGSESLTTTTLLDGLGRMISTQVPNGLDGVSAEVHAWIDQAWDGRDRVVWRSAPHAGTGTGGSETTWDALSRPVEVEQTDGTTSHSTSFAYDKLLETRTDPSGVSHEAHRSYVGEIELYTPSSGAYDPAIGARAARSAGWNSYHVRESRLLDATEEVTDRCYATSGCAVMYQQEYLDQDGSPWLFLDYQALDSDSGTYTGHRMFERNAAGDLECEAWDHRPTVSGERVRAAWHAIDYAGRREATAYGLGDTATAACTAASTASASITWTFDAVPGGLPWTALHPQGRPVRVEDEASTTLWSYDIQGRVLDSRHAWADWSTAPIDVDFEYDDFGRLSAVELTWQTLLSTRTERIDYGYAHGRLDTIGVTANLGAGSEAVHAILESATWLPGGLPDTWELGNGVTVTMTADGLGRLDSMATDGAVTGLGGDADLVLEYAYDANGNVELVTTGGTETDAYTYDEIDRLTDVDYDDGNSIAYTWDDLGSLQVRSGSSPDLDDLDFDLSGSTWYYNHAPGWDYDGGGQVTATSGDALVLTWHPSGKPASIQGEHYVEIAYDHAGRRSVVHWCETDDTCSGDETYTQYLYDPQGRVLARFESPNLSAKPILQELYVYAGGQLVAFLDFDAAYRNGQPFWVHTDLQGSLRMVTDGTGEVVRSLSWSPLGTLLSSSAAPLQDGLAFAWQPAAYRGVPVVDVGARVRHAQYGWFLSPDPVAWGEPGDPQSYHRSQYARGSPMTYVDPWGEAPAFVYATQAASIIVASAPERMRTTDSVVGATAWAAVATADAAVQDLAHWPLDQQVVFAVATGGAPSLARAGAGRLGALWQTRSGIASQAGPRLLTRGWDLAEFAPGQLQKHFTKHAGEWGAGNITEAAYLKRARSLLGSEPSGEILGFTREGGDVLRYNVRTNEFAVGSAEGNIRTLFRPEDGIDYWYAQTGGVP